MRRAICAAIVGMICSIASGGLLDDDMVLIRGDANVDGYVNQSDIATIGDWLFDGGDEPPCLNQADANDDGSVTLADMSYLANWLYQGGPAPPAPGPYNSVCTTDDAPYPGCENPPCTLE